MEKELFIIIPLFNEYDLIENSIKKLRELINGEVGIAVSYYEKNENKEVLGKLKGIVKIKNEECGKGAMVVNAYYKLREKGKNFIYIDADLPFEEKGIRKVIEETLKGEYDIIAGSKQRAKINASFLRRTISKSYHILSNLVLFGKLKGIDFQTGIKGWKKGVIEELFSGKDIEKRWFFDTELVYYGIKNGKKIKFIPLNAKIGEKSTVRLSKDIPYFLKKLIELRLKG